MAPLLHLNVKDINGSESLCGLGLRYLASDFEHDHFPPRGGGGGGSLSARPSTELLSVGEKSLSEEQVVSPQTYKNNCFHVPESLAAPSDRGRIMEGCTVKRMGG